MMKLEDYFDFLAPDDIRLKGHRIGIDDVLYYYLEGYTAVEIAAHLPTLTMEQIHATITYYLRNRSEMDAYLRRLADRYEEHYRERKANPSPIAQRLRALKAQQEKERTAIA
jgi:uncharacterized protein (DUF433 family)